MNKQLVGFPDLPTITKESPKIVKTLDFIRYEKGVTGEFYWFAYEYARIFRHHFDHAEYCLLEIHEQYTEAKNHLSKEIFKSGKDTYGISYSNAEIRKLYWNFEVFLTSVNSSLDILARLIGTAYVGQMPITFNKICKKPVDNYISIFKKSQKVWVTKMKAYRDCFVHYTPIDTLLSIGCNLRPDGWNIRCKLPINPESKHIIYFKYNRRTELLAYCIKVYKKLVLFDRKISLEILKQYKKGKYPMKQLDLFKL